MGADAWLNRAADIGADLGRSPGLTSLPLIAELRRLDAILPQELLASELTWIDGRPHVVVGDLEVQVTAATVNRIASTIADEARRAEIAGMRHPQDNRASPAPESA